MPAEIDNPPNMIIITDFDGVCTVAEKFSNGSLTDGDLGYLCQSPCQYEVLTMSFGKKTPSKDARHLTNFFQALTDRYRVSNLARYAAKLDETVFYGHPKVREEVREVYGHLFSKGGLITIHSSTLAITSVGFAAVLEEMYYKRLLSRGPSAVLRRRRSTPPQGFKLKSIQRTLNYYEPVGQVCDSPQDVFRRTMERGNFVAVVEDNINIALFLARYLQTSVYLPVEPNKALGCLDIKLLPKSYRFDGEYKPDRDGLIFDPRLQILVDDFEKFKQPVSSSWERK